MEDVFVSLEASESMLRIDWEGQISRIAVVKGGDLTHYPSVLSDTVFDDALRKASAEGEIIRLYLAAHEDVLPLWEGLRDLNNQRLSASNALIIRNPAYLWRSLQPARQRIRVLVTLTSQPNGMQMEQWGEIEPWIAQVEQRNRNLEIVTLRNPSRRRLTETLLEAEDEGRPFQLWHFVGTAAFTQALDVDQTSFDSKDFARLHAMLSHLQGLTVQLTGTQSLNPTEFGANLPLLICATGAVELDLSSAYFKAFYLNLTGKLSHALMAGQSAARRYSAAIRGTSVIQCFLRTTDDDLLPVIQPIRPIARNAIVRDQVFISYSHVDQVWCDRLMGYLDPLRRNQVIKAWFDGDITVGSSWEKTITYALDQTKVAVLLVSGEFFRSSFIMNTELPYFLSAREQGDCIIIWVAVRAYPYELTPLNTIQSLHNPTQPLDRLDQHLAEDILIEVARLVVAALK